MPRRIGLIVNPVAGLGARVGLKGTDRVVDEARRRGARAEAGEKAARFLAALPDSVSIVAAAGSMGEDAAEAAGASVMIAHTPAEPTTGADTREAARALVAEWDVDLVAFVGGDGTAADVLDGLRDAGREEALVLGVPAGSKMYSSVFADTPEHAAAVVASYDDARGGEVLDIDETAFRNGDLRVRLHGAARVPHHRFMQSGKLAGADDEVEQESLGEAVAELVRAEAGLHLLGAGTTMQRVKDALGIGGTLLGIDAVAVDATGAVRMAHPDASERDLLALPAPVSVTVSPIGGQGFILGRGNLPISPAVLRRARVDRVRVVATPSKLVDTPVLRVDTGDPALDGAFPAWMRVVTGHHTTRLAKVST